MSDKEHPQVGVRKIKLPFNTRMYGRGSSNIASSLIRFALENGVDVETPLIGENDSLPSKLSRMLEDYDELENNDNDPLAT